MPEIILAPYAAYIHCIIPGGITGEDWAILLSQFMERLALECDQTGASLIGHIKGMVLVNNTHFLKLSVTTTNLPTDLDGTLPDNCRNIRLAINVLVYGLTEDTVAQLVQLVACDILSLWSGNVRIEPAQKHTVKIEEQPNHH